MKNTLFATLVFGIVSISNADMGNMPSHGVGHWESPEWAKSVVNPIDAVHHSINKGRDVFVKNCVTCHGENADGKGVLAKSLNPKPTNLVLMSSMHTDGDFKYKIDTGRGAMPPWKDVLNENDIWHLVNYIQSLSKNPKVKHMKPMGHMH